MRKYGVLKLYGCFIAINIQIFLKYLAIFADSKCIMWVIKCRQKKQNEHYKESAAILKVGCSSENINQSRFYDETYIKMTLVLSCWFVKLFLHAYNFHGLLVMIHFQCQD